MTDITLAVALPLLVAFVLALTRDNAFAWLGQLLGPLALALSALILFAHWSGFSEPAVVMLGGFTPPLGIVFYVDQLALLFAIAVPLLTLLLWPDGQGAQGVRRQSLTLLLAASLTGLTLSATCSRFCQTRRRSTRPRSRRSTTKSFTLAAFDTPKRSRQPMRTIIATFLPCD